MDLDFWKSLKATFEAGYDKPPARRVREWLAGSPWVSFQVVYSRNLRLVNCGVFFRVFFWGGLVFADDEVREANIFQFLVIFQPSKGKARHLHTM